MDVRCEKCGTEYELEESRLKPGGVTVKCTNCEHLFRVRKNEGVPAAVQASSSVPAQRTWLIRLEDGEIRTTAELATLQQWIAAGLVNRNCEISRTGKTWKQLGEINELASFFRVADEARGQSLRIAAVGTEPPSRRQTGSAPLGHAVAAEPAPAATGLSLPGRPGEPRRAVVSSRQGATTDVRPVSLPEMAEPAVAGAPSDGGNSAVRNAMAGFRERITDGEAAFALEARGKAPSLPPADDPFGDPLADDYDEYRSSSSGQVGKWIVVVSLVILLAAMVGLYVMVFRTPDTAPLAPIALSEPGLDAAAAEDGGDSLAEPAEGTAAALETAAAAIPADGEEEMQAAADALAELIDASKVPADLVQAKSLRARLLTALAQHLFDRADVEKAIAGTLREDGKKMVAEARELAGAVLERDRTNSVANIALADALRLQGRNQEDVEGYLRPLLTRADKNIDAEYVQAMVRLRDRRPADARRLLSAVARRGDVRGRYRLALMAMSENHTDAAREDVEAVLAAQPEHAGAKRLLARLDEVAPVVESDPLPPEVVDQPSATGTGGNRPGGAADSYDRLLARADSAAENGKCDKAMELYDQALDDNPGGVAALTGMAYCHVEFKQFVSAHAKFRAALGISPRYQEALIGIAEAYRFQGLRDKAIAAYETYLQYHPTGERANMARKQIERLQAASPGSESGGESGGSDSPGGGAPPPPSGDESPSPSPSPGPATAPQPIAPAEPPLPDKTEPDVPPGTTAG